MGNIYFDESIRDSGKFIVGAAIYSEQNLTALVHELWKDLGLPHGHEYKSSVLKRADESGRMQRSRLYGILQRGRVGLVVCPTSHRKELGKYAVALLRQLLSTGLIPAGKHVFYLDEGIPVSAENIQEAAVLGILINPAQDSRMVAGLQVADLAAHSTGGMLLEQLGILKKTVRAGENSGYDPDLQIEIGFELWASLRYYFFQVSTAKGDETDQIALANHKMEGYGLYIAPSCPEDLAKNAKARFGENYLGCIH
ncbi:MAG: hypothetical protein K2X00_09630 [Nitrospiraceae bacterium]|nr:hypothetical protein [Nitrospiraceae bacterium]